MDIQKLTESLGLKVGVVAEALWPNLEHPRHAYYHHIKTGGELTESQIIAFSKLSGIPVDVLLGLRWTGRIGPRSMLLSSGKYTIEYTSEGPKFRIMENGHVLGEHSVSPGISVSVFLDTLEKQLISHLK